MFRHHSGLPDSDVNVDFGTETVVVVTVVGEKSEEDLLGENIQGNQTIPESFAASTITPALAVIASTGR